MPKIRVLIVDDAVVIRKILSDAISADPDLEVVGTAANGKIALEKIPELKPDIVTLDIEMPEMDGLETLRFIRRDYPKLPVIMFSTLSERGAKVTFEALAIGAADYVTKPANVGNVTASQAAVKEDLISKIKWIAKRTSGLKLSLTASASMPGHTQAGYKSSNITAKPISQPATNFRVPTSSGSPKRRMEILAIGVSTGGPNALAELIPTLPAELNVPVVIVQHMPAMFTKLLADRLNSQSPLRVVEAVEGMIVEAGTVYIAPGEFHLEIIRVNNKLLAKLHQGPRENSCRPAVDVLFRSVVSLFSGNVLGVILTGMGQDGLKGCEAIKEKGGIIIAQDKESSVVWGMPGYVAEAGLADSVLPLSLIGTEILKRLQHLPVSNANRITT